MAWLPFLIGLVLTEEEERRGRGRGRRQYKAEKEICYENMGEIGRGNGVGMVTFYCKNIQNSC